MGLVLRHGVNGLGSQTWGKWVWFTDMSLVPQQVD